MIGGSSPVTPSVEGDFVFEDAFPLDGGGVLESASLHYAMYGEVNDAGDNVVFVAHALSGSARVGEWWPQLLSSGGLLDNGNCVLGINILGSCYGSTGPSTMNPRTGRPYGSTFPAVSMADIVRAQARLLAHLEIRHLKLVMGASIGGMQAMQWAVQFPQLVDRVIAIGAAPLQALGLGLNHLQRRMIQLDPRQGLALARALAVCTYKSAELLEERFARKPDRSGAGDRFDVSGYLDYQGEKFVERFDANAYLGITRTMDAFDPTLGYASAEVAYRRIQARVLLVGISSDWLFPPQDIAALAAAMREAGVRCDYQQLRSSHGHDAFLAEPEELAKLLRPYL